MRSLLLTLILLLSLTGTAQKKNEGPVKLQDEQTENGLEIYGSNSAIIPYTLLLSVKQKNLKSDKDLPLKIVLPAQTQRELVITLTRAEKSKGWSYGSQYSYFPGDFQATHDDDFIYRLPFSAGEKYLMSQGYNGRFSHSGKNALDFTMPVGTKVVAARGGIVTRIKEDSNRGCGQRECIDMANLITIMHEDGTFADYAHLKKKGALVAVGDRVKKGDEIGLSGNTGFTSGPHLHFEVYLPGPGHETIKTKFETAPGKEAFLEKKPYLAF